MEPEELAESIIDEYIDIYATGRHSHEGHSITIAAFDLGKIDTVVTCLEQVKIRTDFLEFYENKDNLDLYQYAKRAECKELMDAINDSLIKEDHMYFVGGNEVDHVHGMTIY